MWIHGGADVTISTLQPPLLALQDGAPPVHITRVRLLGRLRVEGSELELVNCSVEASIAPGQRRRGLSTADERALAITGGKVALVHTILKCHSTTGGIVIEGAAPTLTLDGCSIEDCRAATGAALLVRTGSVNVENTSFVANHAVQSGGALQV